MLGRVPLFVNLWTVACQAPLSIGFSSQEYQSGQPFPPQGILPTQGLNPCFLHWQADSLPLSYLGSHWTGELETVQVTNPPPAELASHSFLKDADKDLIHIPKLFLTGNRPPQTKTAKLQNIDPRLIGTRRLVMLTPHYLITNQSEECPQADHALLFEYSKLIMLCSLNTLRLLIPPSKAGHIVLRALVHCDPLCLAKQ